MLDQFSNYNNWANSLLLETLLANSISLPESCVSLFSHIINAQMIWVARINGTQPKVSVWQLHDLDTCSILLKESIHSLSQIELPGGSDSPVITYRTSAGEPYQTSVADILMHVFNHGTYHRAQIAKEMKSNHLSPVNTDYIQFVRVKNASYGM
jgi:uncharacterized damage-inducible protein DinB